jgi:osmotically-inducible protein OsmY
LTVDLDEKAPAMANTPSEYVIARVRAALAEDGRVGALDVKVTVRAGRLHLTGQVDSEAKRRAVEMVARAAAESVDVQNDTTVVNIGAPHQAETFGRDQGRRNR